MFKGTVEEFQVTLHLWNSMTSLQALGGSLTKC